MNLLIELGTKFLACSSLIILKLILNHQSKFYYYKLIVFYISLAPAGQYQTRCIILNLYKLENKAYDITRTYSSLTKYI